MRSGVRGPGDTLATVRAAGNAANKKGDAREEVRIAFIWMWTLGRR